MDKNKKSFYKKMFGSFVVLAVMMPSIVNAEKLEIYFPLNEQKEQTQTISLPSNFASINWIRANNGTVSYNIKNNKLVVTVNNGDPVTNTTVYNAQKYSKSVNFTDFSGENNFADVIEHTDGEGYTGKLYLQGAPYVVSGQYLGSAAKTVEVTEKSLTPGSFPAYLDYREGAFKGNVYKVGNETSEVIEGGLYQEESKKVSEEVYKDSVSTSKYGFRFDGETYVQLPSTLNNFGSGDFTIEGFFEINDTSSIIYAKNGLNPYQNQVMFGVYGNQYSVTDGTIIDSDGYYTGDYQSSLEKFTYNQKMHVALVVKNNTASIYQDGVKVWEQTIKSRTNITQNFAPVLGMETDKNGTLPTDFFKGYMYEVRLYDKALTEDQVKSNKNKVITERSSLVGEYLFNDGSGKVIKDSSGKGNNGTVVGNENWIYMNEQSAPVYSNTKTYDDGDYAGEITKEGDPQYGEQTNKLLFDGSIYVELPKAMNTIGAGNSDIAIEGWFEIDPRETAGAIYALNGDPYVNDNNFMVSIWPDNSIISTSEGNGTLEGTELYSTAAPKGKKVHYVWQIKDNIASIYINGILDKKVAIPTREYTFDDAPKLGTDLDYWVPSDWFNGYMYEVRIYNKGLTDEQVLSNMKGNITKTGLKAEYLFEKDETNLRLIKDTSGNGNHGYVKSGYPNWKSYLKSFKQKYAGNVTKYQNVEVIEEGYSSAFPSTIEYKKFGFQGTISSSGETTLNEEGYYEQKYVGRVFSAAFDDRVFEYSQRYAGFLESPMSDTSIWRADYSGSIYKGGVETVDNKFSYKVEIDYATNVVDCTYKNIGPPSLQISNYKPKCVTVSDGSDNLYDLLYNFRVSGISSSK